MQKKHPSPESLIIDYLEAESAGSSYVMDKLCQWQRVEVACAFMAQDPNDHEWLVNNGEIQQAMLVSSFGKKTVDFKEILEYMIVEHYTDEISRLFESMRQDYETMMEDRLPKRERDPEWQHGAQR